jgi:hypothetical protein
MTTVEVAPYFRLFLFIEILNTEGSMYTAHKMFFSISPYTLHAKLENTFCAQCTT